MTDGDGKAHFREKGYLLLPGFFSSDRLGDLIADVEHRVLPLPELHERNLRCRFHPGETGLILESLDPIVDLSPAAEKMANDPKLREVLGELLGDAPCLFKDKLILKPPGANGYALHQDYIHWPGFPTTFTTVVIALDRASAENGGIELFPGLHRGGVLAPLDGDYHDLPESLVRNAERVRLDLEPGDLAIFGCFLPHRSAPNRSASARRQLYFSYNAQFDGGDQRGHHYRQFHNWLRERYGAYGAADVEFK